MDQSGITLRELHTHAEYQECVTIQKETWGNSFTDVVPVNWLVNELKLKELTGRTDRLDKTEMADMLIRASYADGAPMLISIILSIGSVVPEELALPMEKIVRIELPMDIQAVK